MAVTKKPNAVTVINEVDGDSHIIEIIRPIETAHELRTGVEVVEVVRPGGTVVNIGSGPEFPDNPYEGLIWIKT